MKRNDWILIISVLLYSLLFYQQSAGINFLIFTVILIALLLIKDHLLLKRRKWLIAAAGSLISSFSVAWHGNLLSVIATIISLSILSGLSYNANSPVILSLLFSLYSYFASPVFMILDYIERKVRRKHSGGNSRKLILVLAPIVVTVIFFFIYRSSNALFNALAGKINLDFISWNWIVFTFWGSILLYGFFCYKRINALAALDDNTSVNLLPVQENKLCFFGYEISLADENFSGTLLFVLLNLLLLIVNVLDINFLFGGQQLSLGVSYKQFVHQGVNMLIISIIVAISIILFFFRGGLNFYEKNKTIKTLACLWVAQNALMVFSTVCRNNLYIGEYGLTYKRIGVYIYLLLTLIGLATTLIKVLKKKNNMYLFLRNGWIFYGFLILFTLPGWENIVTSYNINHVENPDAAYLLSISNSNLIQLLPLYKKDVKDTNASDQRQSEYCRGEYCAKLFDVLSEYRKQDWRSWYYDESKMYKELTSPGFTDKITSFDIEHTPPDFTKESIRTLGIFKNVKDLKLNCRNIHSVSVLEQFPLLKNLDLSYSGITNISGIEKFKHLQSLDLRGTYIIDYSPMFNLKNLKTLYPGYLGYMGNAQYKIMCENMPHTKIIY